MAVKIVNDEMTANKKAAFVVELACQLTITTTCRKVKVSRQTVYRWRHEDPSFAKSWDEATQEATVVLEDSMYDRALKGDTTAAIFMLKAAKPEKYRERSEIRLSTKDVKDLSDEELMKIIEGRK